MTIFDQADKLRALYAPPESPGAETGANFPLGFYEDFLKAIIDRGITVVTYDDLFDGVRCEDCDGHDDWDYESNYHAEFQHWHHHRRDPEKTYLILQHDVDNVPSFTQRMVAMEHVYGIRSNIFIFCERYSRGFANADYSIDHDFFRAAQDRGFVIGYHQNAFQLANFKMDDAIERYRRDIAELREQYDIRYVVPHGGVGAKVNGHMLHNFNVPMPEEFRTNLRWVFNGHGIRFTKRWSDGGLRRMRDPEKIRDYDLIERFLENLKPGTRNFCLVHPQRWGFKLEIDANPLLVDESWYQQLCRRYPGTICTSIEEALMIGKTDKVIAPGNE